MRPPVAIWPGSIADGGIDAMHYWWAVRTRTQREEKANTDLKRAGFSTFYPIRKIRRLRARKHGHVAEWVQRPFFPGWLFVEAKGDALHLVLGLDAVAGIASMGSDPVAVPVQFMSALIACADVAGIVSKVDCIFERGEAVEFRSDVSLAGLRARVVQDDGSDRVRVLVDMLGGEREMIVSAGFLRKTA